MKTTGILAEQMQRGVTGTTGVRTKCNCWQTVDPRDIIFDLEVPTEGLDKLMMELGINNVSDPEKYHADIAEQIYAQSFCISAEESMQETLALVASKDEKPCLHVQGLLKREMPHAIYRVCMMPDCVVLSSFSHARGIGEGGGVEIAFRPKTPLEFQIDYPLGFRDKSDFAIVRFSIKDDISVGQVNLIQFEEYQQKDTGPRLIRRVESSFGALIAGYQIGVQKKEYPHEKVEVAAKK